MHYELYIDLLFLENFMMDSLLLLVLNRVLKCKSNWQRIQRLSFPAYFLKKSGILIDCSFTLLEGVLGCSVGIVPPCGLTVEPALLS